MIIIIIITIIIFHHYHHHLSKSFKVNFQHSMIYLISKMTYHK